MPCPTLLWHILSYLTISCYVMSNHLPPFPCNLCPVLPCLKSPYLVLSDTVLSRLTLLIAVCASLWRLSARSEQCPRTVFPSQVAHTYTHKHAQHSHTHTHICTHIYTHTCTYTHTHNHTHTHTQIIKEPHPLLSLLNQPTNLLAVCVTIRAIHVPQTLALFYHLSRLSPLSVSLPLCDLPSPPPPLGFSYFAIETFSRVHYFMVRSDRQLQEWLKAYEGLDPPAAPEQDSFYLARPPCWK